MILQEEDDDGDANNNENKPEDEKGCGVVKKEVGCDLEKSMLKVNKEEIQSAEEKKILSEQEDVKCEEIWFSLDEKQKK